MTAAEILKLIETVDPADSAGMDEIDAAVADYLGLRYAPVEYTRSRDALKAVRPEGWYVGGIYDANATGQYDDGYYFILRNKLKTGEVARHQLAYRMPTEELAELHAIIQAIEYERTKP